MWNYLNKYCLQILYRQLKDAGIKHFQQELRSIFQLQGAKHFKRLKYTESSGSAL